MTLPLVLVAAATAIVAFSSPGPRSSPPGPLEGAAADPTVGVVSAVSAPFPGRLEVLRGFDPPPVDRPWLPGHRGVDLGAGPWAVVLSASAGTVTYAGPLAGRGVVVVASGRLTWTYEPVLADVAVGQAVGAGTRLGRLQPLLAHCHGRPCLHWGLKDGDRYLDPLASSTGRRDIRLLPLGKAAVALAEAPALALATGSSAVAAPASVPPRSPPPGAVVAAVAASAGAAAAAGAGAAGVVARRRRARPGRGP